MNTNVPDYPDGVVYPPIHIVTYRRLLEPKPEKVATTTWAALAVALTRPKPRGASKKDTPLWSPVEMVPGGRRRNADVRRVGALVLDYDGGYELDAVLRSLEGITCVYHATWSATREEPRVRVVMPLARPHDAEHWRPVCEWAYRRWPWADAQCSDPSRAYYMPTVGVDGWWAAGRIDGQRIEVAHLRVPPKRTWVTRRAPSLGPDVRSQRVRDERDPVWRADMGQRAGATVDGTRVKHAPCPQCGRASVWWLREPAKWTGAACEHRNSCGWAGSIREVVGV